MLPGPSPTLAHAPAAAESRGMDGAGGSVWAQRLARGTGGASKTKLQSGTGGAGRIEWRACSTGGAGRTVARSDSLGSYSAGRLDRAARPRNRLRWTDRVTLPRYRRRRQDQAVRLQQRPQYRRCQGDPHAGEQQYGAGCEFCGRGSGACDESCSASDLESRGTDGAGGSSRA